MAYSNILRKKIALFYISTAKWAKWSLKQLHWSLYKFQWSSEQLQWSMQQLLLSLQQLRWTKALVLQSSRILTFFPRGLAFSPSGATTLPHSDDISIGLSFIGKLGYAFQGNSLPICLTSVHLASSFFLHSSKEYIVLVQMTIYNFNLLVYFQ